MIRGEEAERRRSLPGIPALPRPQIQVADVLEQTQYALVFLRFAPLKREPLHISMSLMAFSASLIPILGIGSR